MILLNAHNLDEFKNVQSASRGTSDKGSQNVSFRFVILDLHLGSNLMELVEANAIRTHVLYAKTKLSRGDGKRYLEARARKESLVAQGL